MSKAQRARLIALEARHEGQDLPKPSIVAIKAVDGTISADMPYQMGYETFADEAALEARANELGLQAILVRIVDARKNPEQDAAQCVA